MNAPKYRQELPQLAGQRLITDGGLETTLIFHDGVDLPCFASFVLLRDRAGERRLWDYYAAYAKLARDYGRGFLAETPTWRANPDWGEKLGYSSDALAAINAESVEFLVRLRQAFETPATPIVISGNIGPRGDGYRSGDMMSPDEAQAYHAPQIELFAKSSADMAAFYTVNYADEALGVARAAKDAGIPVAISFTVETDGRLPSGQPLKDAIVQIDAETDEGPAYYMINCAHPSHFSDVLAADEPWLSRLLGIRANASRMSHAELDESETLDDGDPNEFGEDYRRLLARLPQLTVLGGCCGTDHRHVARVAEACRALETGTA